MKPHILAVAIALAGAPIGVSAQPMPDVFQPSAPAATTLTPQALDQLVAPIALYPDPLLTDILAASTYPAEVVEAQRWRSDPAHAALQGQALTDAAAGQDWDPSVQALTAFPQVLAMMDSELSWTDRLGRAFMGQQSDLMSAVQRLRHEAQLAGTLQNGAQDQVVNDGDNISISPPSPQQLYLPSYDAACVYGPNADCSAADDFVGWDTDFLLPFGYWQWGAVDWGDRSIHMDHGYYHRSGHHYGDRTVNEAGQGTDIWRHAGPHGFTQLRQAGNFSDPGNFQYAAPANEPLDNRAFYGRAAMPAPVFHANGNGAFRAPVVRSAPVHFAARGGGIGGHR